MNKLFKITSSIDKTNNISIICAESLDSAIDIANNIDLYDNFNHKIDIENNIIFEIGIAHKHIKPGLIAHTLNYE